MSRLSERYEELVEKGSEREVERRRLTENYFGEGGIALNRAEKMELFKALALDPSGAGMADVLRRRQEANKLGPTEVPTDFGEWVLNMAAKLQGHPVDEGG
jgi:hypothetical protein